MDEHSRVLQFARLSFDASVSEMAMSWQAGATLCLLPGEAREVDLARLLRQERISVVTLPLQCWALWRVRSIRS